jgi:hypothetical protein
MDAPLDNSDVIDLIVDVLFWIDIFINFISAYEDRAGLPVTNLKLIAKNYVQTFFFLDLIAVIPVSLIEKMMDGGENVK